MPQEGRQIRLQARPGRKASPDDKTPEARLRRLLRGAMMVGKEEPMPPDHLYPNLWSATAYDSFKYSHLRRVVTELLGRPTPDPVKEASVTEKDRFIRANREAFRRSGEEFLQKEGFSLNPFNWGKPKEPSLADHINTAIGGIQDIIPAFGAIKDAVKEHPVAVPLGAAGLAAAGMGLHKLHEQGNQLSKHHHAFNKAMEIFPELHSEDPEKIHMLWSSAVHAAPTMSTNPLLLGTWIKSLAKGSATPHLSPLDLKQLQDLEVAHAGRAPDRQGVMGNLGDAVQLGSNLSTIMRNVQGGGGK